MKIQEDSVQRLRGHEHFLEALNILSFIHIAVILILYILHMYIFTKYT